MPRLLSEYLAARAQSEGWISAEAIVDLKNKNKHTSNAGALSILETTTQWFSDRTSKQQAVVPRSPD
jgi:hypothetical protein